MKSQATRPPQLPAAASSKILPSSDNSVVSVVGTYNLPEGFQLQPQTPAPAKVDQDPSQRPKLTLDLSLVDAATWAETSPGPTDSVPPHQPRRSLVGWLLALGTGIGWLWRRLLGLVMLVLGLAVLAPIPVVQFVVLGYFFEVMGRLGRCASWRQMLPGVTSAAWFGGIVVASWLWLLPVRYLADLLSSARLIDPLGQPTQRLETAVVGLFLLALFQIVVSIARGGHWWAFAWPIGNGRWVWRRLRGRQERSGQAAFAGWHQLMQRIEEIPIAPLWWKGVVGAFGTLCWLALPCIFLVAGRRAPGLGLLGGLLLSLVVLYLPFLQVRYAMTGRFRSLFDLRTVRQLYCYAPMLFFLTVLLTLATALPLYLAKIEVIPQDAWWLLAILFVATALPMKLLAGFAVGWASYRQEQGRRRVGWYLRWPIRLLMWPAAAFYSLILFFVPYTSWKGAAAVFEQHAFLMPSPF